MYHWENAKPLLGRQNLYMTTPLRDQAWLQIAVGLSTSMPGELQYQRLVDAICDVLPCDAVALLKLQEGELIPVAKIGRAHV